MLGIWRNIEDLENSLCLSELEAIVKASRDKEHRHNKFMAAIQGIDIDKGQEDSVEDRFEAVQRRAEARMSGRSEIELEFNSFGLDIEIEE